MKKLEWLKNKMIDVFMASLRGIVILGLILEVISVAVVTIAMYNANDKSWEKVFYYPETEYQLLEEEAQKMIESKNFETEYRISIKDYDSLNKILRMELIDYNCGAFIKVTVTNFGDEDETISIYRRYSNPVTNAIFLVIAIILVSYLFASFPLIVIYFLILLFCIISCIILRVYKKRKNKQK